MDSTLAAAAATLAGTLAGVWLGLWGSRRNSTASQLMQSRIQVYGDLVAAVALHRLRRMDWWHREQEGGAAFEHRAATHQSKTECHAALGRVRLLTTQDDVSDAASTLVDVADAIRPDLSPDDFAAHRDEYFTAVDHFLNIAGREVRAGR